MRMVVIVLVLLTGFKVWTQDHLYRSVMSDAVAEAYRDRALEVCRRLALKHASGADPIAIAASWSHDPVMHVVVGNSDVDVAIWDTNNPEWDKRYRHPNIVLKAPGDGHAGCTYDVADGSATLAAR